MCSNACGPNGVCDEFHDICVCRPGWKGEHCNIESYPSCKLSWNSTEYISCNSIRRISPVSCDCLVECLRDHEICAPGSFGCERPWRRHKTLLQSKIGFFSTLTCIAFATPQFVTIPLHESGRLMTLQTFLENGYDTRAIQPHNTYELTPFEAGMRAPTELRSGGYEALPQNARFVAQQTCNGCSNRGRCVRTVDEFYCMCIDGAYGKHCEHVCTNDCLNHCSGKGKCVHGWCKCDPGWYGTDCSASSAPRLMHTDPELYKTVEPSIKLHELPSSVIKYAEYAKQSIYIYDLPHHINRYTEMWMARQWGVGSFEECDPIHARRIYSSQAHFESRLFHDRFVRTYDPSKASLFYVPTFFLQRYTWNANIKRPILKILKYIQETFPYWHKNQGRDHVWFISGERSTCNIPDDIRNSIIVGLWGDLDCVSADKDIVVPSLSPIQHDMNRYKSKFLPFLQHSDTTGLERNGSLLFFAGGIFSFGASQDNVRKTGKDSAAKIRKWTQRVQMYECANANVSCRHVYSMGVRQALWKYNLHKEPDVRIVSAGVPDYQQAIQQSQYCLHTEGNSWGTRIIDYMAFECIPLIVNDRMLFSFQDVLPYSDFSLHVSKRQIPNVPNILRSIINATQLRSNIRTYKRAFIWWSDEGLAYEFTIASLGYKIFRMKTRKNEGCAKDCGVSASPHVQA